MKGNTQRDRQQDEGHRGGGGHAVDGSTDEMHGTTEQGTHPEPEQSSVLRAEVVQSDVNARGDQPEGPSVSEPSKLLRIASMTRAMLDEVREAPLDEAGRDRLRSIYQGSLDELKDVLSDDLVDELDAVFVPINDSPSVAELRVAQAQLVGWLEGLFHGIQASLISQQMAAAAQLERLNQRKAIEQTTQGDGTGVYL